MKKLFTILIIAVTTSVTAQRYSTKWSENDEMKFAFVSLAFDARHLVTGSKQTDNETSLNFIGQVGANYKGWEVGIEYENHSKLTPKFQRYGVFVNYGFYAFRDLSIYNGISYGSIIREANSNFLSFGYNGEIRYDLSNDFTIGAKLNIQERKDIEFYCPDCPDRKFVASAFLSIYYKL